MSEAMKDLREIDADRDEDGTVTVFWKRGEDTISLVCAPDGTLTRIVSMYRPDEPPVRTHVLALLAHSIPERGEITDEMIMAALKASNDINRQRLSQGESIRELEDMKDWELAAAKHWARTILEAALLVHSIPEGLKDTVEYLTSYAEEDSTTAACRRHIRIALGALAHSIPERGELRCEVTGNPVGTDARMVGAPPCLCRWCIAFLSTPAPERKEP